MENQNNEQLILNKQKKKAPVGAIIGACAGVAVVAGGITAFAVPSVNNSLNMAFSSPESYTENVINKAIKKEAENTSKVYKNLCDKMGGGKTAYTGNGSITVPGTILGIDKDLKVGADASIYTGENTYEGDYTLKLNDKELIDAIVIMNQSNIYSAFPTISDDYFSINLDEMIEYGDEDITLPFVEMSFYNGETLNEENITDIYTRYSKIVLDNATDVSIERNIEKTATNGISQKFNIINLNFDSEAVTKLETALDDEAKNDSELKKIWNSFGLTEEDYNAMFAESDTEENNYSLKNIDVKLYVSNTGEIVGSAATLTDSTDSTLTAEAFLCVKGRNFGYDLDISIDENNLKANFGGSYENGIYAGDGNISLSSNDTTYTIPVKFSNVDRTKIEEGEFTGEFEISYEGNFEEIPAKFVMTLSANGDNESLNADLTIGDYGTFNINATIAPTENKEIVVPEKSYKLSSSNEEDYAEVEEYIKNLDLSRLKANIEQFKGEFIYDGEDLAEIIIATIEEYETMLKEGY